MFDHLVFVHPPGNVDSPGGNLGSTVEIPPAALLHLGELSRTPRCIFMLGRTAASSDFYCLKKR